MNDAIIEVDGLGKRYRIGAAQKPRTRGQEIRRLAATPFNWLARTLRPASDEETLWALRHVSFQVRPGEVVGIIGRNGAGKSTLLKILSRITEPSEGRAVIRGRVASLLEVGTGFHPELTGRENIYLNGAILGMKKAEIARKFDEIVAFSEVEKFLDTPVKHYSSGMYVRLAFAVAAHLEPEILIVDEVLAVGDVQFQKKCLGKMEDVATSGRTVLFVSHQVNAVRSLCGRCLHLAKGNLQGNGPTEEILQQYLDTSSCVGVWNSDGAALANDYFKPTRLAVVGPDLNPIEREIGSDERGGVLIEGVAETLDPALTVGFALYTASGELLFWTLHTDGNPAEWPKLKRGANRLVAWLPAHFLNEGRYRVELIVSLHYIRWISEPGRNAPAVTFSIRGGLSDSPQWTMRRPGSLAPILKFDAIEG